MEALGAPAGELKRASTLRLPTGNPRRNGRGVEEDIKSDASDWKPSAERPESCETHKTC